MSVTTFLSWLVCGLIVGLIARLLVPGQQRMSLLKTTGLGILGACVGGLLFWLVKGEPGDSFSLSGNAWHGWVVSILGAAFVLWCYRGIYPRRWWQ